MEKIISVTKGIGEGNTKLAAFDAALWDAGIANYNLIILSSIIPTGFTPKAQKVIQDTTKFGDRLYLVMQTHTETEPGKEAWAGLGWVTTTEGEPKGLFVEHVGGSAREVETLIKESLGSMVKYRPEKYGPIQHEIAGAICKDKPACALVAAVYKSEPWN